MKRLERVYRFVLEQEIQEIEVGVTTLDVASALDIQRSNASKDLNALVRAGKIQKTTGRPVRYLPLGVKDAPIGRTSFLDEPDLPDKRYVMSYKESPDSPFLPENQRVAQRISAKNEIDIFSRIIGVNGSMRSAVEQAKAAILYPPQGLNCLITGPTGSGKTYFAHAMFRFAVNSGVIASDRELIVFNCADYANNPELLMSHLFGYVKGAFTGADADKIGIIDQADGGMLFLDEIHRLPPEGQEMIFYFMDHGTYSRLGESSKNHQADVRIIGATTEDPSSSLLATFVRRIPISIGLPAFNKRPPQEQVDLVKLMIAQEAGRIQRRIVVTQDVVKALIGSVSYGNIGQLKSNIQLVCARGFLNHMNHEEITISFEDIPEGIRSGVVTVTQDRQKNGELSKILEPKLSIDPRLGTPEITTDSYELPYNLYDIIGDKASLLKADGLDQEAINQFISTDINIHLKSFYKDHGFTFNADNKLAEFVDEKIIETTNHIYEMVSEHLQYDLQQNFLYAMSLHISSFLKKLATGEERHTNDNIRQMVADYPEEFAVAQKIRNYLAQVFQVVIPASEDYYLAVLLISLAANQKEGKIGVVVAAHGDSTATSMVRVVTQLLGADHVKGVDMPLDMPPQVALEKIQQATSEVSEGGGVLLLVDMGSLATFSETITRNTGIAVRTIDMVTTALVLEAVRKASVLGSDLESIYESLRSFNGYGSGEVVKTVSALEKAPAILAICASGEGTAMRIKEIIQRALTQRQLQEVAILTESVADLSSKLPKLEADYQIIASTGIVDPKLNAPFIPLDQFLATDVRALLNQLLSGSNLAEENLKQKDQDLQETAKSYMEENFTFINVGKLFPIIWDFVTELVEAYGPKGDTRALLINLAMHVAGMIERVLLKEPLTITKEQAEFVTTDGFYERLHLHVQSFERLLRLEIPVAEEYYLLEILNLKSHQEEVPAHDFFD
ncbi:sigma 54-interacting transcriptional regulator [Enterococcus asini]|uniref:sigma-54-dependent transcriptional regulator n=1 Tax=Enterococcus asini TaxID=57732 RepID=UPI00289010AA|nr:sigma 54-interacting transcriptional regulator [Enterococcus asini]MDT2756410.1 sigma 54-interacting transcriptional regulator [Enterococcus asini]